MLLLFNDKLSKPVKGFLIGFFLVLAVILLSGCASISKGHCDRIEALEQCEADREAFFSDGGINSEDLSPCAEIVPQCD